MAFIPVKEDSFKRLSLLQGQLVRNVQHVAGLNPKAFRSVLLCFLNQQPYTHPSSLSAVRNDRLSRPLNKGILDGNLLEAYLDLQTDKQLEMTRQIGTERSIIMKDLGCKQISW